MIRFSKTRTLNSFTGVVFGILCLAMLAFPHTTLAVTIFLTSGTSWTVPADWNNSANTIEVIGGGGGGGRGTFSSSYYGGGGGGGGAYSRGSNVTLTPATTVSVMVGSGGAGATANGGAGTAGGDTYFCNSTSNCASIAGTAVVVGAKGGGAGTGATGAGGAGGAAASGVGTTKYSGGTGGAGGAVFGTWNGGGGGGGAAGSHNNGANGGAGYGGASNGAGGDTGAAGGGGGADGGVTGVAGSGATGGAGGNNRLGTGGGAAGSAGSSGGGGGGGNYGSAGGAGGTGEVLWTQTSNSATAGPGGGGGGGGSESSSNAPGAGGGYGGGGGGTGDSPGANGGAGVQGIIVITYTPVIPNTAPSAPTITGPTSGYTDTTYTFTLSGANDPEDDDIHYAIDWDYDDAPDAYAPAGGGTYLPDLSSADITNDWGGEGAKTFQVRSEDDQGAHSGWVEHTITLTLAPPPEETLSAYYTTPGTYQVRGIVEDDRGARSAFSDPITMVIAAACTDCYPLYGYAWSDTVGWISLNCENTFSCGDVEYHVEANTAGVLSGYAWSDNVGWISANQTDVNGCPSGGTCTARIHPGTGEFAGWMKVLSASDGWDGWISLSCANDGNCATSTYHPILDFLTDAIAGFAWGDFIMGWIDFQWASTAFEPLAPDSYMCLDEDTLRYVAPDYTITDTPCPYAGFGYGCDDTSGTAVCLVPPTPGPAGASQNNNLRARPSLVHSGNTTEISWNIENATTCTVTGATASGPNGDSWTATSSVETSSPITERTTYTLHCESGVPGFDYDATATVNIAPSWREI